MAKKDERKVKVLAFSYQQEQDSPTIVGQTILVDKWADQGAVIDVSTLRPIDKKRAEDHNVFYNEDELDSEGNPILGFAGTQFPNMTDDQLVSWIKGELDGQDGSKPNVQDVVDASDGDPAMAERLLAAESIARDGDVRTGVQAGLQAVIDRGGQ